MRRIQNGWLPLIAVCVFVVGAAACDETGRGVDRDPAEAADEAREAPDDARQTAGEVGAEIDATLEAMDVKAALMADESIDASNINVEVLDDTKMVVLKGSVASQEQKARAERIASNQAPGYRVDNQLAVRR